MKWRRVMFDIWAVLSVLWGVGAALIHYPMLKHFHMHAALDTAARLCLAVQGSDSYRQCFNEQVALYLQRDSYRWWIRTLAEILVAAIGPPLLVLGVGAMVAWTVGRFRRV